MAPCSPTRHVVCGAHPRSDTLANRTTPSSQAETAPSRATKLRALQRWGGREGSPPASHTWQVPVFDWKCPCLIGKCPCLIGKCPCLIGKCPCLIGKCPCLIGKCPCLIGKCPCLIGKCPCWIGRGDATWSEGAPSRHVEGGLVCCPRFATPGRKERQAVVLRAGSDGERGVTRGYEPARAALRTAQESATPPSRPGRAVGRYPRRGVAQLFNQLQPGLVCLGAC